MEEHTPPPGAYAEVVGRGRRGRVFIRINEIKEKIIDFFSLCVNYNNRSPVVGNDNLNDINCHRRATKIYELTKDIVTNNIVLQLYF